MDIVCLHLVALHMGVLVASCGSMEYIGCYEKSDNWSTTGTYQRSGHACKQYCVPHYRYAGISLSECFCGSASHGKRVSDTECNDTCLDPQYNDTCGDKHKVSVYDTGKREQMTSTETSCFNQTTFVYTESTPRSDSLVTYISASLVVVTLVMVIMGTVMIIRCYRRRRAKSYEISQTLNNSCYRIGLPDIEEGIGFRESSFRVSADLMGEYDRLKMPEGVFCLEPTAYSHTDTQHLRGACMRTDNAYNHCDIPRGMQIHATAKARGYDQVHFSRSGKCKVGQHIPVQYVETDRVYSYDKLQNNVLTKPKGQKLNPNAKQVHVKSISKVKRTAPLVVKDKEKVPVKAKRSNTYDEIEVI